MALPDEYWRSYEHTVGTLGEFLDAVQKISAYQSALEARFVWRGAINADWALYSSLARRFVELNGSLTTEEDLQQFESGVLDEARHWGLDWHAGGGRLTALELMSAQQHYGVPTRLIDFTYNPFIALWFAAERDDDTPGRVFAIDISQRLVDRAQAAKADPWWFSSSTRTTDPWMTESWVWRPPPLETRIVRQEGCFVMGGIPSTSPPRNALIDGEWRLLRQHEVRACMSLPFRLVGYRQAEAAAEGKRLRGTQPTGRAFTLRILGKRRMREELYQVFGLSYRSLFPDFPGLAQYGEAFR